MTQAQELENLNMLRESGLISDKDYQLQYDIIHKKYNALPEPDLGMHDYTRMWFRKAFTWRGRATRSEFWWPLVEILLIAILLGFISFFAFPFLIMVMLFPFLAILIALTLWALGMWISIALMSATIRRFHDMGLNTWIAAAPWIVSGIKWILLISFIIAVFVIGETFDWQDLALMPELIIGDLDARFSSFSTAISILHALDGIMTFIWFIICMFPSQKGANHYGRAKN